MNKTFFGPRRRHLALLVVALASASLVVPRVLGASAGLAAGSSFRVEIGGVPVEALKEVTGLESEIEVIEFRDGDDPVAHKRAGAVKYKNIILKRGLTKADTLSQWVEETRKGEVKRKSGSVILTDRTGAEVLRYNFFEAWPCRWQGPELNADAKDPLLLETVTLCIERFERVVR